MHALRMLDRRFLLKALSVLVIFAVLSPLVGCRRVEGRFEGAVRDMILIVTATGEGEVLVLDDKTELRNLRSKSELRTGERVRAVYSKEAGGVKLAEVVEVYPDVELFDSGIEISVTEMVKLAESGEPHALYDTRAAGLYEAGHIPGAVSMTEFDMSLLPLDKGHPVIFYSGSTKGPSFNTLAGKAVAAGYVNTGIFAGGVQEWVNTNHHLAVTAEGIRKRTSRGERIIIVDVREMESVKSGHIPGAVSISLKEVHPKRLQRNIAFPDPVVFYGEDGSDRRPIEAARRIAWGGYAAEGESMAGVLEGGLKAWGMAGHSIEKGEVSNTVTYEPGPSSGIISIEEFREIWEQASSDKLLLKVGGVVERYSDDGLFMSVPVSYLHGGLSELPGDKEIIVYCSYGYKARIAYHILKNIGYRVRYLNRSPLVWPDGTFSDKQE